MSTNLNNDDFTALSFAVGSITLNWAQVELTLDFAVSVINQNFRHSKLTRQSPLALKRKLDYLKKALKVIPELEPVREAGFELLPAIRHYGDERHKAAHSAAMHRKEDAEGVYLIRKFGVTDNQYFLDIYEFDVINQYPVLLDEILDLIRRANDFAEAILRIVESNTPPRR